MAVELDTQMATLAALRAGGACRVRFYPSGHLREVSYDALGTVAAAAPLPNVGNHDTEPPPPAGPDVVAVRLAQYTAEQLQAALDEKLYGSAGDQ